MHCVVTAGPTYEALDNVRRLTNFSTGKLGTDLANHLVARGHRVTLLTGEQATYRGPRQAQREEIFSTTNDLSGRLRALATQNVDAVFHAAAVSDFGFGKVWLRSGDGKLSEIKSGKISTRQGTLLAELTPTPKIISKLRDWYPKACLVGWKFEVDGNRASVIGLAEKQLHECRTDACIANGPAFGPGFGLIRPGKGCVQIEDDIALFEALERLVQP
jgi:phosphopantothenoylcysteine synthetase/decarboxylase